jgi:hypothetical protein
MGNKNRISLRSVLHFHGLGSIASIHGFISAVGARIDYKTNK